MKKLIFFLAIVSMFFVQSNYANTVVFEFSEVVVANGDTRDRAVAFHSITFIDSIARPMGNIVFGTSEANDLQGEGWFENEVSPDIGNFQWAGGTTKQAELQLDIPIGTEGLLLKINSVKDSLWMKVWIDGQLAATLRVDSYWHSGYVPIGEAIPEPKPSTEPEWIQGRYFPHFPSTDRIYAIKANHGLGQGPLSPGGFTGAWLLDWRINDSYDAMMALTLVCMQGIINRNQPRVYLDWNEITEGAAFWIPFMEEHVEVEYLDLDGLSALNFLLRRYSNRFEGAVIFDPAVPNTINLATMIAGLENRLVLAPEQLTLPGMPTFNSVRDLRQTVQEQGWDDSEESQLKIYQWVYDSLWQDLEHRIIGFASPGPPTSGEVFGSSGTVETWPIKMAARDYLVALKLPVLHLNLFDPPQADLFGQFLEEAPSPVPVTGVFAGYEIETMEFISSYGDWVCGFTWPGTPLDVRGLTVFSGIRPDIKKFTPEIDLGRILATLGDSPVATLWSSDGDGTGFATERGYYPFWLWEDTQDQRFSWTFNPTVAELSPLIWNYFMDTRSEVGLMAGFSGAGYTFPEEMSPQQLEGYLEHTAHYLEETGMRTVHAYEEMPWTDQLAVPYHEHLSNTGFLGTYVGTHGSFWGLNFDYLGVSSPSVWPAYIMASNDREEVIDEILSKVPGEYNMDFVQFLEMIQNPHTQIVNDPDAHGGQAVLVKPESINHPGFIFNSDDMVLAPGDYTVEFRMKVEDNQSANPIASFFVGTRFAFPDWQVIANRQITANELQQPNEYQTFSFTFSLDSMTSYITFRIDYGDGVTNWYADDLQVKRIGGADLPVFTGIFIVLTIDWGNEPELNRTVEKFTESFESQGGIVLNPDEYMAALNPQYMIELATPILGANDPRILEATAQLNEGEYFTSLLTIRKALKEELPNILTAIEIDPQQITLEIGEQFQFTTTGYNLFDEALSFTPTWSAEGGTINSTGLYSATEVGEFNISVFNTDSTLTATSEVLVVDTVSLLNEDSNLGVLKIYPNPVRDQLSVELPEHFINQSFIIDIKDVLGRTTNLIEVSAKANATNLAIDLTGFSHGVYLLSLKDDKGGLFSKKFIKN